jgi:adenylate cyclase
VVLPFVNLSGNPAEEYFSDVMTDEIITEIAALSLEDLAVIARTTAMHYKSSHKDVGRIGHELGVDYVVEGTVRRADGRVGINIQLIQVKDQTHLFAQKYDA